MVHLKSIRNTVPVPRHWCFKRKYLQGKRGIEKPPFDLPEFIKKTGIMEMREALQEKEQEKSLKSKMREKVRPKLGKIDIDYQKLHDAFFKWQTKPRMTYHGDLYYEGKEFEIRLKEKKPGDLTDDLRTALGMPVGPNAHKVIIIDFYHRRIARSGFWVSGFGSALKKWVRQVEHLLSFLDKFLVYLMIFESGGPKSIK